LQTKPKRAAIYVRVSTNDQDTALQEAELRDHAERRGWEVKLYRDHGESGAKENRPALNEMLCDIRRGKISCVMIWSLDRMARSLKQLLSLAEEFRLRGIDLISLKQAIDTASPAGMLTYQVLGAVAEFERAMLSTRVRAGLEQARRRGKRLGRPAVRRFSGVEIEEIREMRRQGASIRKLAHQFETTQFMISKLVGSEPVGA
jgi:DNA invertase Pin-like site-specific DNA recombinase